MAADAAVVARYNGGDNAGHTVTVGATVFKLHQIPSGIIHPRTLGIIGPGVVFNPATFFAEIETLRAAGVSVTPERLQLSYACHLITPGHRALDIAQERQRGAEQIGTTGRGIGPAYTDKAARRGLRLQDMLDPERFHERMLSHIAEINRQLTRLYEAEPLNAEAVAAEYVDYALRLRPFIADTGWLITRALRAGQNVLAEGAQGTLLDIDAGTYPFVTSSSPTAAGALTGLGIGIVPVGRVVGVTKAFQTRVGAGPFPTELLGEAAVRLRGTGSNPWDEFGTTTGRPRRVGWLDGVLLRYAARCNGLSELVVTKLDVLSGLEQLQICTHYRHNEQPIAELLFGPADLAPYQPIYETLPGWSEDITAVRHWQDLPAAARDYIRRVAAVGGVPISRVSVGPEREQIVECGA
jgi:adenylosuccinate synthase